MLPPDIDPPASGRSADTAPPPAAPDPRRAWLEIVLCSGYPTQLLLGAGLTAAGLDPFGPDGGLSGTFVFVLALLDTVLLLSLIFWLLHRRGERPAAVFFGDRPFGREAAAGVLSFPVVMAIVIGLSVLIRRFLPWLHDVETNPLEGLLGSDAGGLLAFAFVAIVAGGLREELQRAFLLHRFRTDIGSAGLGLAITSVAFGLGHTLQGSDAAVLTGALGAAWGFLYLRRGSAVAPIVSHSLFNSGELLRAFLVK
jgi:membrane protease YdiL (CAAX protease family)